jgi:hypothetical protein
VKNFTVVPVRTCPRLPVLQFYSFTVTVRA